MVRPADQNVNAVEEVICYSQTAVEVVGGGGSTTPRGATCGSPRVGQVAEGVRRKCEQEPLWWFPWEGKVEAGEAGLGLASWNNFSGL